MGILFAARPWSFTAAVVPIGFTAVIQGKSLMSPEVLRLLGMGILTQAGANLVNTYWDHKQGVDEAATAGDRGIVDKHVSPSTAVATGFACFAAAAACGLPYLQSMPDFRPIFVAGSALALLYTAPPFCLKYRRLGDIVIFLCFGPLLMQACSVALTGKIDPDLYAYSVPIGLLTEAILWANNARDIESDTRAKVKTVCSAIGFEASQLLYKVMVYLAYGTVAVLAYQRKHPGLALPLITLPLAAKTCAAFEKKGMKDADERSAQLHLPFGALMILGIAVESYVKGKA